MDTDQLLNGAIARVLESKQSRTPPSYYADEFRILAMEHASSARAILADLQEGRSESLAAWMASVDSRDERLDVQDRDRTVNHAPSPRVIREREGRGREPIDDELPGDDLVVSHRGRKRKGSVPQR